MPRLSQDSQKPNRQGQGLACDECRARKLRCDRVRPTCGTCENLDIACTPNTSRKPRGPRRGHLKALQSRISALERQVSGHDHAVEGSPPSSHHSVRSEQSPEPHSDDASESFQEQGSAEEASSSLPSNEQSAEQSAMQPTMLLEGLSALQSPQAVTCDFSFPPLSSPNIGMIEQRSTVDLPPDLVSLILISPELGILLSKLNTNVSFSSAQSDLPSHFGVIPAFQPSELIRADLNHLYFDRVHLFAPILSSHRYFARAARPMNATAPFVVLQYAMWTLAACLGSQFKEIRCSLYNQTRTLLGEFEHNIITDSLPIEVVQAWLLLAIYEITQVNYDRGWLSAGRCFRLVQLMKLYEIDVPNGFAEFGSSFIELEERRRTFWMAYILDRFINLMNQMPLTLNEQVILTRLPAPEAAFDLDRPTKTRFLSEVITGGDDVKQFSPFNSCIVLVTISGRCLSHQQQCIVERAYGNMPQDFLSRHQWLESLLAEKIEIMLASGDVDDEPANPLLLFTSMAAQATTLLLAKAIQSVPWSHQDYGGGYEPRVIEAAQKVSQLSQRLAEFSYFKIHPFTPIPLFFCAEFAQERKHHDPAFQDLYDAMASALQHLSAVNMLAETCLAKFNAFGTAAAAAAVADLSGAGIATKAPSSAGGAKSGTFVGI